MFFKSIAVIEGHNMLSDFNVSSYPYMKKNKQDRLYSRMKRQATYREIEQRELTTEDLYKYLNGELNGQ